MAFVIQGKAHYVEDDEKTVITKVNIKIFFRFPNSNFVIFRISVVFPFMALNSKVRADHGLGWNILIR